MGLRCSFVREATPDGEPDVPENEGHFGNYTLTALGDNKIHDRTDRGRETQGVGACAGIQSDGNRA